MPLTLEQLEDIQSDAMADDVDIVLTEMSRWSEGDARRYFESGGQERPSETGLQHLAAPPPLQVAAHSRPLVWWRADGPTTIEAASRVAAHTDKASRVRLFVDVAGALGTAGETIAASGSWDASARLWRVCDAFGALVPGGPEPVATLKDAKSERWVYDLDVYPIGGSAAGGGAAAMGVVTTHTGGWTSDPVELIRLWSVSRDAGSEATSACFAMPNVEGADVEAYLRRGGAEPSPMSPAFSHRRGVHAVGCSASHAVTVSEDLIVAWGFDRSDGRASELSSAPCPVPGVPAGARILSDGTSVVVHGNLRDGRIELLDLNAGFAVSGSASMRGGATTDVIELCDGFSSPPRLAAAAPNRAFVWDARTGAEPVARLPVQGIVSMAAAPATPIEGGGHVGGGVPLALVAATPAEVLVFDVRKLPAESPQAKKAPAALARLVQAGGSKGGRLNSAALSGSAVVAADADGALHAWDIAASESE